MPFISHQMYAIICHIMNWLVTYFMSERLENPPSIKYDKRGPAFAGSGRAAKKK